MKVARRPDSVRIRPPEPASAPRAELRPLDVDTVEPARAPTPVATLVAADHGLKGGGAKQLAEAAAEAAGEASPVVEPSAPPPPDLRARLAEGAEAIIADRAPVIADGARLRAAYGIPEAAEGSDLDGFSAMSNGHRRMIGLLRRDGEGTPRLSVELAADAFTREGGEARVRSTARQLETLRALDPDVDLSLVLAVGTRESGPAVLSASRARVDSFHEGGLDHLGRHVATGRIRPPRGYGPWPTGAAATNEAGRPAQGAMVPRNELLVAYGLELQRAERIFEAHVHTVFGDDADRMLTEMSPEARRAWTQITFGGPGGAHFREGVTTYGTNFGSRTALEMLHHEIGEGRAEGLDDVLTNEALGGYTRVRRGRVTAAEAESYDRWLVER